MKKLCVLLMALVLILSTSLPAFALNPDNANHGQNRKQNQTQTEDSTKSADNQKQARLTLKIKLKITDKAKKQKQDKERQQLNNQDQVYSCFNDVDAHWAKIQVKAAFNWGLINGYPDGSFSPDGKITGTEGTLMVGRLLDCLLSDSTQTVSEDKVDWSRVPDWAREHMKETTVLKLAANTQCYGQNKLDRLQFAVMLAKAMGLEPSETADDTALFTDQSEIPEEDLGYIAALYELGIIQGDNGAFRTERLVTRAEAAAMLTRVLDILEEDTAE